MSTQIDISDLLILALLLLQWWTYYRRDRSNRYELMDIIFKTMEAMNLVSNNLDKLRDANEDDAASLREKLDRLRTEFLLKLDNLAPKSQK